MNEDEAKACARVLLAVAIADGKIDPEERRLIELFGGEAHGTTEAIDLDAEIDRLGSRDARERTMHAALALADVDGRCTGHELAVLKHIHARCSAGTELSLRERHSETRAEMERAREALEEVAVAFLHEVGKRGHELSQKEYEALAADLSAKKREILRCAIGA